MIKKLYKMMMVAAAGIVSNVAMAANNWYVDASMPDDNGDGTSAATAKKYIQSAIDLVDNGDTVYVAPDTYYAAFTLDIEGNLPPLDTLEGWAAGPRQKASWEFVPHGMSFSFR